jgi:NADH-quinone oxidoreductase subunit L
MLDLLWLIPSLPFAGAAINGLLLGNAQRNLVTAIGVGFPGLSLLVALGTLAVSRRAQPRAVRAGPLRLDRPASLALDIGFLLDPLSAVMLFVVTFVGFWIHVYSVGYMGHEPATGATSPTSTCSWARCCCWFSATTSWSSSSAGKASGSAPTCSSASTYEERFPPAAARRRSSSTASATSPSWSDVRPLVALRLSTSARARDRDRRAGTGRPAPRARADAAGFVALCLFVGATGKSAQIPLYVWLPDAMAGPTPVSALIHAATMVTAGVYMVVRATNVLFRSRRPDGSMWVVAVIGARPRSSPPPSALAQNDIKKVLAYSTVSQLGYMFLAAGVGAYTAASSTSSPTPSSRPASSSAPAR